MSKRRNRKQSPNLPPEMLERARQQLSQDGTETADVEADSDDAVEEVKTVEPAPVKAAVKAEAAPAKSSPTPRAPVSRSSAGGARSRSSRRGGLQPAQSRGGERKSDAADTKYVRNRLENPTRFVSTEDLKAEYSYVMNDLRTMAGLAVVLLVAMVVIEKLLGG